MKPRKPKAPHTPLPLQAEMVRLRSEGVTPSQMASQFGLTANSIRTVIRKYTIKHGTQSVKFSTDESACPAQYAFEAWVRSRRHEEQAA